MKSDFNIIIDNVLCELTKKNDFNKFNHFNKLNKKDIQYIIYLIFNIVKKLTLQAGDKKIKLGNYMIINYKQYGTRKCFRPKQGSFAVSKDRNRFIFKPSKFFKN